MIMSANRRWLMYSSSIPIHSINFLLELPENSYTAVKPLHIVYNTNAKELIIFCDFLNTGNILCMNGPCLRTP